MSAHQKSLKDLGDHLTKITKELDKAGGGKGGKKTRDIRDLEPQELTTILTALTGSVDVIRKMLERGEDDCPKVRVLEDKTRVLEDEMDHHHQRALRGKFIISSNKDNNKIVQEKKLKEQGKTVPQYVVELVNAKLGVEVKEEEIVSCHHTRTGLAFRLGDLKPGSSFNAVVSRIKGGAGKDVTDIYINFALTPRRASILYEIRKLKKATNSKIQKFYVDFDGNISVVSGKEEVKKERVTSVWERVRGEEEQGAAGGAKRNKQGKAKEGKSGGHLWSITPEEVRNQFGVQV